MHAPVETEVAVGRVTPWQVQVVGHVCIDLVPALAGTPEITPGRLAHVGSLDIRLGGCVGNTGSDLAALGLRPLLVTALGDDQLASVATALIAAQPGADHRIAVAPGTSTSYSLVVQPPGADRTFWHHLGANAIFDAQMVDPAAAPLLHIGYLPLLPRLIDQDGDPLMHLLRDAVTQLVTTSIDMCVVEPQAAPVDWAALLTRVLPLCDIVSPSLDDLRSALATPDLDADAAAEWLLERGPAVVVVTDGPRLVVVRTAARSRFAGTDTRRSTVLAALPESWFDRHLRVTPLPTSVVHTTGAGDAATAALLAAVYRSMSLSDALDLVLAAAAHRVAGRGALSALSPRVLRSA
jgi:sugar/nucleoside kinase (ribokinase family)